MKKFKDLLVGDKIYILSYNRNSREVGFRAVTYSGFTWAEIGRGHRRLYFREQDESDVLVDSDSDTKYCCITGVSYVAYFTALELLDNFLKKELEDLSDFRNRLENIHNIAWKTAVEKKTETNPPKTNDFYGCGEFLFNPGMEECLIYDGKGSAYGSDGYSIDVECLLNLRRATEEEKKGFLIECRKNIILERNTTKGLFIISMLQSCGYKWDDSIGDIFHEQP